MEEEIIETIEETFDYNKLRYILNKEGYICHASLGALVVCDLGECTEYNGDVPSGYETIEEWFDEENDKLNAWKVVNGNLIFDEQKYEELQAKCKLEEELNSCASKKYVNDKLSKSTTIFDDNMCSISNDLHILNSSESEIPEIIIEGTGDIKTNSDGYIEDARSVPLKSDFIYGMSIQEITNGYQLIDFNSNSDFPLVDDTITITKTGAWGSVQFDILEMFKNNPSKTMYFSCESYDFSKANKGTVQLIYKIGTETKYSQFLMPNGTNYPLTIPSNASECTYAKVGLYCNNSDIADTEYSASFTKPMLSFTQNAPYEKYTNGASPNPQYPSEIINNRGIENIISLSKGSRTLNGVTINVDDDYVITLNGAGTTNNSVYRFNNNSQNNQLTGEHTLSYKYISGSVSGGSQIQILETNTWTGFALSLTAFNNKQTKTLNANYRDWGIRFNNGTIFDNFKIKVQLEKGSTAHTPVPYGSNYLVHKICGKNIFDGNITKYLINNDGSIYSNANWNLSDYIEVEQNKKYTFSHNDTTLNQSLIISEYDDNKTFIKRNVQGQLTENTPYKITTSANTKYVRLNYNNTFGNEKFQFEKDEVTEYEPYKETLITYDLQGNELCENGDTKDNAELVSGVLTKKIIKRILDGTENWLIANNVFYITSLNDYKNGRYNICKSNYYKSIDNVSGSTSVTSNNTCCFYIYNTTPRFYIRDERFTTTNEFKTWLSNNPIELYYELAEPQTIQLEPTEITLYEGINNIYTESNVDVEEVDITYATQKTTFLDGLKVHISNENILPIETINQSLNELDMAINEDKSISLYGTPTNDTEFILNGSMDNIDPIFMLSKYNDFIVSGLTNDVSLNLYSNDGTNRELVYSGSNGDLRFDDNKIITCATLSVASGKELDIEIQPMITLDYIDYVEGKRNDLIDIPINELNRNEYLKIDREYIKLCDGEDENELKVVGTIKSFNPNTLIQLNDDKVKLTTKYFGNGYINERLAKVEVEQEKINFEVSKKVGEDEVVNAINLSTEEIKIKGNRLVVDADNFQLDKNGTLVCQNATIRGSELILNDDGSFENASIKIKTTKKINKDIAILTDLDGSCITQIFGDKFNFREAASQVIFTTDKNYKVELVKTTLGSASHTYGYQHQVIVSGTNFNEVIYDVTYNQDEGTYKTNVNIQELQLPSEFGVVKTINSSTYLPYIKKLLINAGLTTYSSEGMEADIYSNYKYTRDDYIKVQEYLIGTRTLSAEELLFYDANGDGKVNLQDMIIIGNNGGQYNVSDTENGKFIIDTTGINENLQILDKDNNKVVSMGITGTKVLTLNHPVFPDSHNQIEVGEALTYRKGNLESVCGTWIDGKLIYRKVFQVENITATTIPNWSTMIELDIDIDTMVKIDGCYEVTGNAWTPINMPLSTTQTISTHYNSDTKQLHIMSTFDISRGHIILEYTKNE